MKRLVNNYVFNSSQKNIIFLDYIPLKLENILLVYNITRKVEIFNNDDLSGDLINNVLYLDYDTTNMNVDDKLQIWVWDNVVDVYQVEQKNRIEFFISNKIEMDLKSNYVYRYIFDVNKKVNIDSLYVSVEGENENFEINLYIDDGINQSLIDSFFLTRGSEDRIINKDVIGDGIKSLFFYIYKKSVGKRKVYYKIKLYKE